MTSQLITTYLQDHHAGSAAGVDAFRRVAESHGDPEVRAAVARIADQVAEEQQDLESIMASVGARPNPVKDLPAKVGEKLARLKLNERIAKRSPLSDVMELEALVLAVHGKSLGWSMLLSLEDDRLDRSRISALFGQARAQEEELEALRHSQAAKLLES